MNCSSDDPNCSACTENSHVTSSRRVRRRDGLPRRARDPQLLDVRPAVRAPGPHVRAQRLVEPPRSPVHGLRVVGVLYEPADPSSCRGDVQNAQSRLDAHHARRSPSNGHRCTPGPTSPTCSTRRTSAGATTCPGHRARLRERRGDVAARPSSRAPRRPASGTRCPRSPTSRRTASSATSSRSTNFFTAAKNGTLPAVSWIDPNGTVPSTRRRSSAPARPTSPAWSTRS